MSEYKVLIERMKKLRSRYHIAWSAFNAYESINESICNIEDGDGFSGERNDVLIRYSDFFLPSKESLRVFFLLELAKFFDVSKKSLSIVKVINFAESERGRLTADDFEQYYQGESRDFLQELVLRYKGISDEDLKEVRSKLKERSELILKIKTYRDKWLAHDDLDEVDPPSINKEDVLDLFLLLEEIMNLMTRKLSHATTMWDHVAERAKRHSFGVIDHLRRFEPYRIKEIEDDCKREEESWRQQE